MLHWNTGGKAKLEDLKSLWHDRHSRIWSFYCPQCRAARRTPTHPDPARPLNIARVLLCAWAFTIACWSWFGWKGIVSFVPFWAAFEIFHRSRMRGMLACPHCGFDPYLYLVDVKLARKEIDAHWRRKFAEHGIPFPSPKHGDGEAAEGVVSESAEEAPVQEPAESETTQNPENGIR
jgi:hypothetical protein